MLTAKPWERVTIDKTWWANQCRMGKGAVNRRPRRGADRAWVEAMEPRVLLSAVDPGVQLETDPPVVTIAATDNSANEDGPTGTFTITRTGDTSEALTVDLNIAGTADNGTDYTAIPTSVVIAAGESSASITVTPIQDLLVEGDESVQISLAASANYTVGAQNSATVTILDDDTEPTVTINATDPIVQENDGSATMVITRTGSNSQALQVNLNIGGSATNGTDYQTLDTSVIIPAGASSLTINIEPIDDNDQDGDETVIVTLQDENTYAVGDPDSATVTILDDDSGLPEVSIVATNATTQEPNGIGVFTVTRTGPTTDDLTVDLQITGTATAGSDYQTIPVTVTIPSGQSSVAVNVEVINDNEDEPDETVIATLQANAAYNLGDDTSGTVTIQDDDVEVVVNISAPDDKAIEGGNTGTFTVTRTGSTAEELVVNLQITGTAAGDTDYNAIPVTVTIAAGQATADITVSPVDDGDVEDDETVIITLQAGTGYGVGDNDTATVTILDNDTVPVVIIAATDSTADEGGNTGTFVVTRFGSTAQDLTINLNVGGSATNNDDYQAIAASVTILAGQSTATITVTPIDDGAVEGDETVVLTLQDAAGYNLGDNTTATVTIQDNEAALPTVSVVATDTNATEGGDTGTFTITRSNSSGDLVVNYAVSGSADNGTDYTTLDGTVTIPDGQTSVTVTVNGLADAGTEGAETVILTLLDDAAYNLGDSINDAINIVDPAADFGDLAIELAGNIPGNVTPGQEVNIQIIVSNVGTKDLNPTVLTAQIFLLPINQDFPTPDDDPVFSDSRNLAINEGQSRTFDISFNVPTDLDNGQYHLVAVLDPNNALPESNELNNFDVSGPIDVALSFGNVNGDFIKRIDVNGIRYTLKGPGKGTVILGENGEPDSLLLEGTTEDTKVTIKALKGVDDAQVQDIDVLGSVASIKLNKVDVLGDITSTGTIERIQGGNFTGAQQTIDILGANADREFDLKTGMARNLNINSNIAIGQLKVVDWVDDDQVDDVINAPSIDLLQSKGDFEANVNLSSDQLALNKAKIKGALMNAEIRARGDINQVQAGVFQNSNVFAGLADSVTTLPIASNEFQFASRINNIQARGIKNDPRASFINSNIASDSIGRIKLRDIESNNNGTDFGIAANTSVDEFRREGTVPQSGLSNTGSFDSDLDFDARIV